VLDGGEPLRMHVTPAVSRAPALLTVRIIVEAAADNRSLEVIAESPDFYRSSQIAIAGRNAPALNVFEFPNLPTGRYEITGVLVGTNGARASVSRFAQVVASPGAGR
jgi:hypothetical protein